MFRKITVFITLILMLLAVNTNLFAQDWKVKEHLDERGFFGKTYQSIWYLPNEIGRSEFEISTDKVGKVKVISCQITLNTNPKLVVDQTLIRIEVENGKKITLPAISGLEEIEFRESSWLVEETIFYVFKNGELKLLNQRRGKIENQPFTSLITVAIKAGAIRKFPCQKIKEAIYQMFEK